MLLTTAVAWVQFRDRPPEEPPSAEALEVVRLLQDDSLPWQRDERKLRGEHRDAEPIVKLNGLVAGADSGITLMDGLDLPLNNAGRAAIKQAAAERLQKLRQQRLKQVEVRS